MSLIDQQKDLESFSDQALLQEATQPMRGYPPYLVAAEIQRRQQDRDRVQRQSAAQQPEAPPVSEQQINMFASQLAQQAPMAAGEAPGADMMGMGGVGIEQPMMAPEAPTEDLGIMSQAPVQGMAHGGEVHRMQAGRTAPGTNPSIEALNSSILRAIMPRRSEVGLRNEIARIKAAGGDASALEAELAKLKGVGIASAAAAPAPLATRPREEIVAAQSPLAASDSGGPSTRGRYRRVPIPEAKPEPGIAALGGPRTQAQPAGQRAMPEQLTEVQVTGKRTDPYYLEMMSEYAKYKPSEKEFERASRAEMLAGLGEIIGGATQRGDIAKGLSALARRQASASRDFQREQREYDMALMGIRGQQRQEQRTEARDAAAIARDDARFNAELKLKMSDLEQRRMALREEAAYRMQAARNDAERVAIQRLAEKRENDLNASRMDLLKAQAEYYRGRQTQDPLSGLARQRANTAEEIDQSGLL
jgi:hypothetical protein